MAIYYVLAKNSSQPVCYCGIIFIFSTENLIDLNHISSDSSEF